ncbi:MAG: aminotransferase class IV, partial [Oscillospiraceae bacterium]|nr:aminotransferase class IV [Oscillospiraceae bacterium]
KAELAGCDEAVLHRNGRVTECSHCNVHIIKNGALRTAPTDNLILPGIARAHLITACRELGIAVDETPFSLDEMMDAAEVIISSSTGPIKICTGIDGKPVGGGAPEIVAKLRDFVINDFYEKTDI